jgi:hypothetical protein
LQDPLVFIFPLAVETHDPFAQKQVLVPGHLQVNVPTTAHGALAKQPGLQALQPLLPPVQLE